MIASLMALTLQQAAAPDLSWIAGYWLSCDGAREISETWIGPVGGELHGTTLNFDGDGVFFERMQLVATADGVAFVAHPEGQAEPTAFPLGAAEPGRAVFENPAHDFPQRVIYSREGEVLTGRIEGAVDGQTRAMEWVYQTAEFNARCPESE